MEYLTINEISKKLGITRQAISRAIKSGKIKAVRIGKQYRISKEWFDEYLKNGGDK